jgi:hypothetical protein
MHDERLDVAHRCPEARATISGGPQLSIRDGAANQRLISRPFFFTRLRADRLPSLIHLAEQLLSAQAA